MFIQDYNLLAKRHAELLALYKVSSTLNQTINLEELLTRTLDTIVGIDVLNVASKGGIMIVEGDRMKIVSHLGHSEDFLKCHQEMKLGTCLCGLSARTGEVIISKNSENDTRHTIRYTDMIPHGHIIIPLKARGKVNGVLYLYLPPDFEVDEHMMNIFHSMGDQIGIVIENATLYKETRKLSLNDPLTGLANRRLMGMVFEKAFMTAKRYKSPLSVIMLDIDHFKKYNDTYGHTKGDKLLVTLANIILKELRQIDLVVRYGGEEFLLILPETGVERAQDVAERIRRTVEAKTEVSVSLGISSYCEEIKKKEELIDKADEAMYRAKQKGRNQVEVSKWVYQSEPITKKEKQYQRKQIRNKRFIVRLNSVIDKNYLGSIKNVSEGGIMCSINILTSTIKEFTPGKIINLIFFISTSCETHNLNCAIIWSSEHSPRSLFKMGMKIIDPPLKYREYVKTLQQV